MSGALGLGAAWVGFCFLVLAVKGISWTQAYQSNQTLSEYGPILSAMILKGTWPAASVSQQQQQQNVFPGTTGGMEA